MYFTQKLALYLQSKLFINLTSLYSAFNNNLILLDSN